MKIITITIKTNVDFNQNLLKTWLKTIPPLISAPGDQTITYADAPEEG